MNDTKITPKLRFPEFTDEWRVKKLGDVCALKSGKFIEASKILDSNNGDMYPCYGANGLRGYVREYNKDGAYSLVGRQGALSGNITLAVGKFYATEHALVAYPQKNVDTFWLFFHLKNLNLSRYVTGQAQPGLSVENLKPIKSSVPPSLNEQRKIANFLGGVDDMLTSLQGKVAAMHEYKRGVMQAMFSGKLRFKDENGNSYPDWETKKLGEVFTERSDRDGNGKMLSVTIANGVIPFTSIERKDNSSADKSNYKAVKKGDIAYNSMRMWQGASGLVHEDGIVSPAYTVIIPKNGQSGEYWAQRFKRDDAIALFQRWSQGLTSDTWNLKYNALSTLSFSVPCLEEQQKIADFLSAIDRKIELMDAQVAATKDYKKALLQRMFV